MKLGRNCKYPCGSGKKYKNCCISNQSIIITEEMRKEQLKINPFYKTIEGIEINKSMERLYEEYQKYLPFSIPDDCIKYIFIANQNDKYKVNISVQLDIKKIENRYHINLEVGQIKDFKNIIGFTR